MDDTGARHRGRNGFCTQIGNDAFTYFATIRERATAAGRTQEELPGCAAAPR